MKIRMDKRSGKEAEEKTKRRRGREEGEAKKKKLIPGPPELRR